LAFGEGDAAGDGFTVGLGLLAGVLSLAAVGEDATAGDGLAVPGEFEFSPGSQPAANMIEKVARSRIAARLMELMLVIFISFPSFQIRLKSEVIVAPAAICSNECSHRA
jgi:hypothetical protein